MYQILCITETLIFFIRYKCNKLRKLSSQKITETFECKGLLFCDFLFLKTSHFFLASIAFLLQKSKEAFLQSSVKHLTGIRKPCNSEFFVKTDFFFFFSNKKFHCSSGLSTYIQTQQLINYISKIIELIKCITGFQTF